MSSSSEDKASGCLSLIVVGAVIGLIPIRGCISYNTVDQVTVRVDKQDNVPDRGYLFWGTPMRLVESNGKSTYEPAGPQEVFESAKSVFHGKWSASNIVGEIENGGVYKMKVHWFRNEMFNSYRNILEVQRLDKPASPEGAKDKPLSLKVTADPMQFAIMRQRSQEPARA